MLQIYPDSNQRSTPKKPLICFNPSVIALQPTSSKEADKQLDEWLDAARKRGENEIADHVGNNASLKGFLSAVFELSSLSVQSGKKIPCRAGPMLERRFRTRT